MKIKNTTTITNATKETAVANYDIEYHISNETLNRVVVSVYRLKKVDEENIYIGSLSYDNELINCSLPADSITNDYFKDFEDILLEIQTSI